MTNANCIRVDTSTTISSTQTHYMRVVDPNYVEPTYTTTYTDKEDYKYYPEFDIDWEEIREREYLRRLPFAIPVMPCFQPLFNRRILPCNKFD